jgi:hypothetical protein
MSRVLIQGSPLGCELFQSGLSMMALITPEGNLHSLPPRLRKKSPNPIPGYSEASKGLSVQV